MHGDGVACVGFAWRWECLCRDIEAPLRGIESVHALAKLAMDYWIFSGFDRLHQRMILRVQSPRTHLSEPIQDHPRYVPRMCFSEFRCVDSVMQPAKASRRYPGVLDIVSMMCCVVAEYPHA